MTVLALEARLPSRLSPPSPLSIAPADGGSRGVVASAVEVPPSLRLLPPSPRSTAPRHHIRHLCRSHIRHHLRQLLVAVEASLHSSLVHSSLDPDEHWLL